MGNGNTLGYHITNLQIICIEVVTCKTIKFSFHANDPFFRLCTLKIVTFHAEICLQALVISELYLLATSFNRNITMSILVISVLSFDR